MEIRYDEPLPAAESLFGYSEVLVIIHPLRTARARLGNGPALHGLNSTGSSGQALEKYEFNRPGLKAGTHQDAA